MMRTIPLTAVYEPVEEGWVQVRVHEIPAVITAAPTMEEAKEFLLDALQEYLLSLGELGAAPSAEAGSKREPLELVLRA